MYRRKRTYFIIHSYTVYIYEKTKKQNKMGVDWTPRRGVHYQELMSREPSSAKLYAMLYAMLYAI